MQPITPPINPDDKSAVNNLQAVLSFLLAKKLFKVFTSPDTPTEEELQALVKQLAKEEQEGKYGDATTRLVAIFQQQQGIGDKFKGTVEEKTATRLNELLVALGNNIDPNLPDYKVERIIPVLKPGETGAAVANLQMALLDLLKYNMIWKPDDPARPAPDLLKHGYDIIVAELGNQNFGAGTQGLIAAIQIKNHIDATKSVVEEKTAALINAWLLSLGLLVEKPVPPVDTKPFVRGTVKDTNGKTQPGLTVAAYDKDLRNEQLLGKPAVTDQQGNYFITYSNADFSVADAGELIPSPDVMVKVFNDSVFGPLLAQSPITFNAAQNAVIDIVLAAALVSEWERVAKTVNPLLKGQADASGQKDLLPSELTSADIDFIVMDSNLDRAAVGAWSASAKMHTDAMARFNNQHDAEQAVLNNFGGPFFYALCRQQAATTLDAALAQSSARWRNTWGISVSANQVPVTDSKNIDLLVAALELLQRLQSIDPARSVDSPFARILSFSKIPVPQQVALDALTIVQQSGLQNPDALLKLADTHPLEARSISSLVQSLRVHQLVDGHTGLFQQVNDQLDGSTDSIAALAAIPIPEWINMAAKASVDHPVVLLMQANLENQHPLIALQSKLDSGHIQLSGNAANDIRQLIIQDAAKVEIITGGRTPALDNDDNLDSPQAIIKNLGRFVRIGIGMEIGGALISGGINTPAIMIRYGRETIKELIKSKLADIDTDKIVDSAFQKANDYIKNGLEFTETTQTSNTFPAHLYGYDTPVAVPDPNLPLTLTNLFDNAEECMCSPCESMLGQPAYLVDLLNLAGGKYSGQQKTGDKYKTIIRLLKEKRPDILDLPLNCENTEKEIPHIDIVLGILEKAVAPADPTIVADGAARSSAYQQLANTIYPWQLPFDLGRVETTGYLAKLNSSRLQLLTVLPVIIPNAITAETLNISFTQIAGSPAPISEWQLLTEKRDNSKVWKVYGFDTATETVRQISVLLERTGLELEQLEDIITTQFAGELSIDNLNQCKTSEMHLNTKTYSLPDCLDRIHLFTRLHKKLPAWTIEELDKVIIACNGVETTGITQDNRISLLNNIALVKRLSERYSIPISQLTSVPSLIPSAVYSLLGISALQFSLLKAITGVELSVTPFSWANLEAFYTAAERISEMGLTIEQAAAALLTKNDLENIDPLPASIKTVEEIESFLKNVQNDITAAAINDTADGLKVAVFEKLTEILGTIDANTIINAIAAVSQKQPVPLTTDEFNNIRRILTNNSQTASSHVPGDWFPLLQNENVDHLFFIPPADSPDETLRLKELFAFIQARINEKALVSSINKLTGLAAADTIYLLSNGLLPDALAGGPDLVYKIFLGSAFLDPKTTALTQSFPQLSTWVERLFRFIQLKADLKLDSDLLNLAKRIVVAGGTGINWRDLLATKTHGTNLPNIQWDALQNLLWLQQPDRISRIVLNNLFNNLEAKNNQAIDADVLRPIAARFGVIPSVTLAILTNSFTAKQLLDPAILKRAFGLLLFARGIGAGDAEQLTKIAGIQNNILAATTTKELVRLKIGEPDWKDTEQKIKDPIRQQRRDALVAYLTHTITDIKNANDLYEYFLIDPLMEPCMNTTKILEAISATQLLMQRVLFGLEPTTRAPQELKDQWTWMRNYRVWEANRKVFLFPENWLYPELRDDKSSCFKQMESSLGQGELTQDLAVEVFGQFLDDVAQIGQVEVLGMYEDISLKSDGSIDIVEGLPKRRILYIIGRSQNPPYIYYWRKCTDFGSRFMEWTPWQRIELDIQGDHIQIFVLNSELYIAWPQFKRANQIVTPSDNWEISFSWSRLQNNKWRRIETAREKKTVIAKPFQDERDGFAFRYNQLNNNLAQIICFAKVTNPNLRASPPDRPVSEIFSEMKMGSPEHNNFHALSYLNPNCHWSKADNVEAPTFIERTLVHQSNIASGVRISWECWVKVKGDNNIKGYIRLNQNNVSTFSAYLVSYLYENSQPNKFESIPLGSDICIYGLSAPGISIPIPTYKFEVRIDIDGTAYYSSTLEIKQTPVENLQTIHLIFSNFKTLEEREFSLSTFGITPAQDFENVGNFFLHNTGNITWVESQAQQLSTLPDCNIYMNGQKEDGKNKRLFLPYSSIPNAFISPFGMNYTNFNDQYWLLEARSGRNSSMRSGIWYYSEDGTAVFFDVYNQSLTPFASSYSESINNRLNWKEGAGTFNISNQSCSFNSNKLPTLSVNDEEAFWQDQQSGKMTFDARLPYACYNWEVFFHAPMMIADQLSKQHKFEDAEKWLRYIFDPSSATGANSHTNSTTDKTPFLKFRVFKELKPQHQVIDDLKALAQVASGFYSDTDTKTVEKLINRWRDTPFRPFIIARGRQVAFLWRTLFAYLDNLLAWADSLYRQDTRESINEAIMLYVLAQKILGRRPQQHEGKLKREAFSYNQQADKWDGFANFWIDLGGRGYHRLNVGESFSENNYASSQGILYFCMPFNDKRLSYWKTIDDRLFNIRHCRNIEGIERLLALTDPPIDPELLVRAVAAGLDLGDVINGLYAPPPNYRYNILAGRAAELANEAKALGAAVLSAIEKRDAERLSQLRSSNEISLLSLVSDIKKLQIKEAESNITALRASRASVSTRYLQYQRLLGKKDSAAPTENQTAGEDSMLGNADAGLASTRSNLGLIREENEQYIGFEGANTWSTAAGIIKTVGSATLATAAIVLAAGAKPASEVLTAIGQSASVVGDAFSNVSQGWHHHAEQQGMIAGHLRRRDEWAFQSNQSLKELQQIDKQLLANEIRIDISKKELYNHIVQIEQSKAVDEVMRTKFSNEQLYQWMVTELTSIHSNTYRLALDMARSAERSVQRELGIQPLNIIRNDNWDSMRAGLLAGERLSLDIKRLEASYLSQNIRELEITKHISLRQLDAGQLQALKATGKCEFNLPEWLFDMDFPGHYFRRIKSVSISIPCVVGPYSGLPGTLTLLNSKIRNQAMIQGTSYTDEKNYNASYIPVQSIATSTAQNDSGLFEFNLRDERFLPFESAGILSSWRFILPEKFSAFDYGTISDLVLHVRYTARNSGGLADSATTAVANAVKASGSQQLLLDLRRDFAMGWAKMKATAGSTSLDISLDESWFPALFKGQKKNPNDHSKLWLRGAAGWPKAGIDFNPGSSLSFTVTNIAADISDAILILNYSVNP